MAAFEREGLTLFIDFNCLPTYLAVDGVCRLLDETGVEERWVPLVKLPGNTSRGTGATDPLAAYKDRRAGAKRRFAERELQRNCERMGISREQGARDIDSSTAALGLLWLHEIQAKRDQFRAYVKSVFLAVYRKPESVEDLDTVVKKLDQCGVVTDGFREASVDEYLAKLQAVQEEIAELGIFESPAYIYEGECFQGRQHLPLLGWLMSGRNGLPPV